MSEMQVISTPLSQPGSLSPAQERLSGFWAYQARKGLSPATRVKYSTYLEPFTAWVGNRGLGEITAVMLEGDWMDIWHADFQERNSREPAPKTVANHIAALRAFFDWLEKFEHIDRNPARRLEPPKIEPKVNDWLRPHEDTALLAACRSPQERIVVPFLRFSGLRSKELVSLRKSDVDMNAGTILVRVSKTARGRRVIPIVPELRPYIEDWLDYQRKMGYDQPESPFLATRVGTAMRYRQVYDTVKRVATKAGVRPQAATDKAGVNTSEISPHTLRRTFGSVLFNKGARLEVVSRALGHQSTVTTEKSYASLLDETVAAEMLAALN
jgi:integrase/recombinase XerD